MNRFMSVVISLAMLLGAAGKVCAQTDSAQMAAKQYREDIEAVLNRMVEAGAVSARARDSVIAVINSARSGSSQEQAAWMGDIRKEWVDRLSVINKQTESLMDLPAHEPVQPWTSMLPRTLPTRPDIDDKGEWSVSRPLSIYEILARDRQLILTRMIQENPTPEFLKDIQDNHPLWGAILMNLLGLLNIGGPFGNMDGQCRRTSYVRRHDLSGSQFRPEGISAVPAGAAVRSAGSEPAVQSIHPQERDLL